MRKITLSKKELEELNEVEKKITDTRLLKRIQCIKLKNESKKHKEIGEFLNRTIDTISQWIKTYKEKGISGLLKWECKGRVSKLSKEAQEKLKERDKEKPFDTAKEAKKFIEEEYGIDFHVHWVQKILKKIGLSYKKTRLIPGKSPSEEVQLNFISEYMELLEKAREGQIHLIFYDPSHLVFNVINGRCWQEKGKDGTVQIPSNTGRKRISILGGINALDGEFSGLITEANCDTLSTKVAFEQIRNDYKDQKPIVIIVDNASYNRAYATKDFADSLKIKMKFLPPYSPNLNLIERIWKFMKKEVVKNTYYEDFQSFYDAIVSFFYNIKNYTEEVSNLINHKFEIISAA